MAEIIFNSNTDYNQAEVIVKEMFSDYMADKCGCGCSGSKGCDVGNLMLAIDIDKEYNTTRWENDIRLAYKLLKSKCGC